MPRLSTQNRKCPFCSHTRMFYRSLTRDLRCTWCGKIVSSSGKAATPNPTDGQLRRGSRDAILELYLKNLPSGTRFRSTNLRKACNLSAESIGLRIRPFVGVYVERDESDSRGWIRK